MLKKTVLLQLFLVLLSLKILYEGQLSDDSSYLANILDSEAIVENKISSSYLAFSEILFYYLLVPLKHFNGYFLFGLDIVSCLRLATLVLLISFFSDALANIPFPSKSIYILSPFLVYLPLGPLRQSIAVLIPLFAMFIIKRRKRFARTCIRFDEIVIDPIFIFSSFLSVLVHNSCFVFLVAIFFQFLMTKKFFIISKPLIFSLAFSLAFALSLSSFIIFSFVASKQADTYDFILSNASSSGLGLLLYLPLIVPYLICSTHQLKEYAFSFFLLLFYFVVYWFSPYSARFLEVSLVFIFLSLSSMGRSCSLNNKVHLFPFASNIFLWPVVLQSIRGGMII
jgi:hypothetical protein